MHFPLQSERNRKFFRVLLVLYGMVGLLLIYRGSCVAFDGKRYFTLFDDGFVAMRYAHNLTLGNGLVWNPGERVEGFTSPLMVLIYAAAIVLAGKLYAPLLVSLFGLVSAITAVWLAADITALLTARSRDQDALVLAVAVLTMAFYPLLYWSIVGMESGPLVTGVLLAFRLQVSARAVRFCDPVLALLLSAIFLLRSESILFIATFCGFRALKSYHTRGWNGVLGVLVEFMVVMTFAAGYQVFRLSYYNSWWPNTYLLKATGWDLSARFKNGFLFTGNILERLSSIVLPIVVFSFVWLFSERYTIHEKVQSLRDGWHGYAAVFLFLFAVFAAYQTSVGGDPWPPYWRMPIPYIVLLFVAFVLAVSALAEHWSWPADDTKAALCMLCAPFLVWMPVDYNADLLRLAPYTTKSNHNNITRALALREVTRPEATVATFWAGAIPYFSERPSLDPLGKTDAHIAALPVDLGYRFSSHGMFTLPGHNKFDLNYTFKEKQPTVIVHLEFEGHMCAWATQNLEDWCRKNYVVANLWGEKLLLRKGSPLVLWDKIAPSQIESK